MANSVLHPLGKHFETVIIEATGASGLEVVELIQELWSGYGKILRLRLDGGVRGSESIVVKHVCMPTAARHPRGWDSSRSHERKMKSYEVEIAWYQRWSDRCGEACRVPAFLVFERDGHEVLMVLEDLDASGFPARLASLEWRHVEICLRWLAEFHATFLEEEPDGLWDVGTYWHLATRADEMHVLDDQELKCAAEAIDARLSRCRYKTFVHGDAKLANFCFSDDGTQVAAVDFQYVGGGCGMKDVAYFVGSCLDEHACEQREVELLDCYFSRLREALARRRSPIDVHALVAEWRELYPLAWTDFHRFLKGWSPGHWKINSYSERLAREVIARL